MCRILNKIWNFNMFVNLKLEFYFYKNVPNPDVLGVKC
jgi:hypothetical protein